MRGAAMKGSNHEIEKQLTTLLRRVQRIHLSTATVEMDLDRSAYGIMCRLADEGPQRLGALATAFGLDPSTITRQVQALERAGLAQRSTDAADRRASILALTDEGGTALAQTRSYRRKRLDEALDGWPERDREAFAEMLTRFNDSMSTLVNRD